MQQTKSTDDNPYSPPSEVEDASAAVSITHDYAKRIRASRRKQEENLKQLLLLMTGGMVLLSVVASLGAVGLMSNGPPTIVHYILAAGFTTLALLALVANWGARRFAAWSRTPLTILSIIALLAFPIGTGLGSMILTAIYLGDHSKLLTKEYEAIVKATPEMKARTSVMTWVAIALLIGLVASFIVISRIPPEIRHMR